MQKAGIYFLLISGFLGIWFSYFLGFELVIFLGSLIAILSAIFCLRFKVEFFFFICILFGVGFFMLGGFVLDASERRFVLQDETLPINEDVEIRAKVYGLPDVRDGKVFYKAEILEIDDFEKTGRVRVSTDSPYQFFAGDQILISGKVERPENFTGENGVSFDYQKFLKKENISRVISFPDEITLIERPEFSFGRVIANVREFIFSRMSYLFGEPAGSLASGMVFGKKSGLPPDLTEDFRVTGLSHILVFSGFNLTLLVALGAGIFKTVSKKFFILFSIVLITFFVFVSGAEAPALRASLMALVSMYALYIGSEYRPLNALLFGVSLLALISPLSAVYDASFHLSVLATAGLIFFTPVFAGWLSRPHPLLKEVVATTLSAQIAVLPFILGLSGQLSLIGIILNVLFAPVIPILVILSLAVFILSLVSLPVGLFFAIVFSYLAKWFVAGISLFGDLRFASIFIEAKDIAIWLMYIALIVFYIFWTKRRLSKTKEEIESDFLQKTN